MTKSEVINPTLNDKRLTFGEKIAYGIGDTAGNVLFGTMSGMIVFFYTDYMSVNVATIGMIILISRFADGFSDFIMGFVIEHTHSKYGKARPWILRTVFPFSVSIIALFCVPPDASAFGKAVYIFITYNFACTICFTAINLPYSTLSSLMTRNQDERTQLACYRMGMAPWGRIIAVSLTFPIVKLLGDDQRAWIIIISIWAVLALIMFLYTFYKCEERVEVVKVEEKIPFKKSIIALLTNKYWVSVSVLWGISMAHYAVIGGALPYYCKYIFGDQQLYSIIYTAEVICFSLGAIYTPYLSARFTKRNICLIGVIVALISQLAFTLFAPDSFVLCLIITVIRSLSLGPIICCVFSMMADTVEYGQWKHHIRQEGMIFSASGIGCKAGSGIASGAVGLILAGAGYIESAGEAVVQPESVIIAVEQVYNYGLILIWGIAAILLYLWKLDNKYPMIMAELTEREKMGVL